MSDDFIKVACVQDFENTHIKPLTLFGKKIGIIQRADGSFYAIETGCKHQGADLLQGEIVGEIVTCPRHHWKYNLVTGECINHDSLPLRKFPLRVDGDSIEISLRAEE